MSQEQVGIKRIPGIGVVAAFGLLTMSSRQAVGDIVSNEKKSDFVQQHEKINVNLQIAKITRYVSNFEYEEEYEEI